VGESHGVDEKFKILVKWAGRDDSKQEDRKRKGRARES